MLPFQVSHCSPYLDLLVVVGADCKVLAAFFVVEDGHPDLSVLWVILNFYCEVTYKHININGKKKTE